MENKEDYVNCLTDCEHLFFNSQFSIFNFLQVLFGDHSGSLFNGVGYTIINNTRL